MDIAHKEHLEKLSREEIINICLEQEEIIRHHLDDNIALRQDLASRQLIIDTLLKVVKYQNGLNDKGE